MRKLVSLAVSLCVLATVVAGSAEAKRPKRAALPDPDVRINIDLSSQSMRVNVNGTQFGSWKVSTGRAGYWTPRGTWRVQRMARVHYSRQYKAPLPHAIFFVGGVAIHATKGVHKLGTPASHGCVRLDPANAAKLYGLVARHGMKKTQVTVSY